MCGVRTNKGRHKDSKYIISPENKYLEQNASKKGGRQSQQDKKRKAKANKAGNGKGGKLSQQRIVSYT